LHKKLNKLNSQTVMCKSQNVTLSIGRSKYLTVFASFFCMMHEWSTGPSLDGLSLLDLLRHTCDVLGFMAEAFTLIHELHIKIRHQVDKWLYFIIESCSHVLPKA
jgi:hypothetical protein